MFEVTEKTQEIFRGLGADSYSHCSFLVSKGEQGFNGPKLSPFTDIVYFWKDGVELGYCTTINPNNPVLFNEPRIWGKQAINDQTFYNWA